MQSSGICSSRRTFLMEQGMAGTVGLTSVPRSGPGQTWSTIPVAWAILGLFVASRLLMFIVFGITRSDFSAGSFAQSLCQWDCHWYLRTIQLGYDPAPHAHPPGDAANWAFFPVYPMIVAAVWKILPVSPEGAGLLVSNAAALACGFVVAGMTGERRVVLTFCVILFFGPFSFYFASIYTESIFVLLTLICLYFLSKRQYLAAAVAAALLSGTRAVGVFMVLTIVASALRDHLSDGRSVKSFPQDVLRNPPLVLAIFLAPVGLFCYMMYLHFHVGDGLGFSHIQKAWNRELGNPLIILARGLAAADLHKIGENYISTLWCSAWSLFALVFTGYMIWRRQIPEAIFALFCILIPLSTGTDSMPRYIMGIAPLLLGVCSVIATSRTSTAITLPILSFANLPLLVMWANSHPTLI
jgi:Gpi18-like mannosyltransferase